MANRSLQQYMSKFNMETSVISHVGRIWHDMCLIKIQWLRHKLHNTVRLSSFVVWYDFWYDHIYTLMKLEVFGIPALKSTIVFRNAYSTESNSSFSRLNKRSFTLIIFSTMFGSLVCTGDFRSPPPSLCSMCEAASVNNGDKGKELEHCATPSIKRSDQVLCSNTSWSLLSRLRKACMLRAQSTVRNRRRVAIS